MRQKKRNIAQKFKKEMAFQKLERELFQLLNDDFPPFLFTSNSQT